MELLFDNELKNIQQSMTPGIKPEKHGSTQLLKKTFKSLVQEIEQLASPKSDLALLDEHKE